MEVKDSNIQLAAKSGFTTRLNLLMDVARYKKHGRLTLLSKITGLTVSGARLFLTEDRPPKQDSFKVLTEQLSEILAKELNTTFTFADIESYLLEEKGSEKFNLDTRNNSHNTTINSTPTIDPLYASQIILKIREIADEMNIDITSPKLLLKSHLIESRIIRYAAYNNPVIKTEEFETIIRSMLNIAISTNDLSFLE